MNILNYPYELSLATEAEVEVLHDKMDAFNGMQVSFDGDLEISKDYVIKDQGCMIAGIRSCFYFGQCLVIHLLFVDEKHRHQGLGSLLLNKIEAEAKSMGGRLIHLDTFDFQAKDFYLRHGYEIFGVLEDCPPGYKRYYLRKYC